MLRCINKGQSVDVELPEECGYKGYWIHCEYLYDKTQEKYKLSMWLEREDIDDRFKISHQQIDTQYLSGTRDTIRDNICRVIEMASLSGFFDYYIERFEYTYKCFDRGDNMYEKERFVNGLDSKEENFQ